MKRGSDANGVNARSLHGGCYSRTRMKSIEDPTGTRLDSPRGWLVAAAGLFCLTFGPSSLLVTGFGVFVHPLASAFHWSVGQVSFAVSLIALTVMVISPLQGVLLDRFGARRVILLSIPCFSAGLAAMHWLPANIGVYYLAWVVLPILAIGLWPGSYLKTVSGWFEKASRACFGCGQCRHRRRRHRGLADRRGAHQRLRLAQCLLRLGGTGARHLAGRRAIHQRKRRGSQSRGAPAGTGHVRCRRFAGLGVDGARAATRPELSHHRCRLFCRGHHRYQHDRELVAVAAARRYASGTRRGSHVAVRSGSVGRAHLDRLSARPLLRGLRFECVRVRFRRCDRRLCIGA